MSDENVTLVYSGGPATIVELDREVRDGDKIEDVPAGLAGRLLHATGFELAGGYDIPDEMKPAEPGEPPLPTGYREEDLARDQAIAEGRLDPTAPSGEVDVGSGPLEDRTVAQLRALADLHGVQIDGSKKDDLVAGLEVALPSALVAPDAPADSSEGDE